MRKQKIDNIFVGAILVLLVAAFGIGCFLAGHYVLGGAIGPEGKSIHLVNARVERTIPIVAVSQLGDGLIMYLTTEIGVGRGRALVNINEVLADYDTQQSARDAMGAASNYLNEDLSYTDVIFSIESYAGIISGPSAGSAMAAALIATLSDKELKEEVMLSGTITRDGTIGPVGGLLEKAIAAKARGATLFLVPVGQSTMISELVEDCKIVGNQEICDKEWGVRDGDLAEEAGIDVVEVGNIRDAMFYLLSN